MLMLTQLSWVGVQVYRKHSISFLLDPKHDIIWQEESANIYMTGIMWLIIETEYLLQQPLLVSGRRFGTSPLTLKGDSKTYFYNSVSKRRIFILARIVNVIELSFFLNLGFLDFFFFCNFLFPLRDRQTLIRVFIYHLEVSRQISCLLNGSDQTSSLHHHQFNSVLGTQSSLYQSLILFRWIMHIVIKTLNDLTDLSTIH